MELTFTSEQQARVEARKTQVFNVALRTNTDRTKAEQAIAELVSPVLTSFVITWASSLAEAQTHLTRAKSKHHAELATTLAAAPFASLLTSETREALVKHMGEHLCVRGQLIDSSLSVSLKAMTDMAQRAASSQISHRMNDATSNPLQALVEGLSAHWYPSCMMAAKDVKNRIGESFIEYCSHSDLELMKASLGESLFDCLADLPRIVPFLLMDEMGMVQFDSKHMARVRSAFTFAEHAFACWAFPGELVLLDKPSAATIDAGAAVKAIAWGGVRPN